jgi:transposase InsO family protein
LPHVGEDRPVGIVVFPRAPRRPLDESQPGLALAIFDWIEAWYNPRRRQQLLPDAQPIDYERAHTEAAAAEDW